ncbi:MAG: copper amine oxidase N-terminal domain-containing protein, partial [Clostridiaceae bacterium]|nr:copper amine oxidase N-terminal domain-containing protein [Clostridiaceae bacterium]
MKEYRFMTKLLKRSLSLFLVLAFILSGVCAIASDIVFNDIKIMIDGQMLDAKDAQGNKVEPFIIDGTTYLPVRAVSEAFSLKVEYDEKTKTAYIGSITNRETDTGDTFKI